MIDHCISAFSEYEKEKTYCIYVTDSLQALVNSSGRAVISSRWIDLITPKKVETRSAEEIKQSIIDGLKGVNK